MLTFGFALSRLLSFNLELHLRAAILRVGLFWREGELILGLWGFRWTVHGYDRGGSEVDLPSRWWRTLVADWQAGEFRTGTRLWAWQRGAWCGWKGLSYEG